MAVSSVLQALTAILLIQLYSCADSPTLFLYGADESFNRLCTSNDVNSWFPMPDNLCRPDRYVICYKKMAWVIDTCAKGKRFNKNTKWCVPKSEIPTPPGCPVEVEAKSCPDIVFGFLPHNETCTRYIWCVNGYSIEMLCPSRSMYIAGENLDRCMYDYEPYLSDIPEDKYRDCRKKEQFYVPPTTTTSSP